MRYLTFGERLSEGFYQEYDSLDSVWRFSDHGFVFYTLSLIEMRAKTNAEIEYLVGLQIYIQSRMPQNLNASRLWC